MSLFNYAFVIIPDQSSGLTTVLRENRSSFSELTFVPLLSALSAHSYVLESQLGDLEASLLAPGRLIWEHYHRQRSKPFLELENGRRQLEGLRRTYQVVREACCP